VLLQSEVFVRAADEALAGADDAPSDAVARSLPAGRSVLDVASARARPAGVDPNQALLERDRTPRCPP
jgi:hypothetical protein